MRHLQLASELLISIDWAAIVHAGGDEFTNHCGQGVVPGEWMEQYCCLERGKSVEGSGLCESRAVLSQLPEGRGPQKDGVSHFLKAFPSPS